MTLDSPCCTAARRTTFAAALSLVVLLAIGCQPQSPVAESAPAASDIELKPIEVAEAAAASPANYEQPAESAAMAAATTNFTNAAAPQADLPAAASANAVPADAAPAEPAKLALGLDLHVPVFLRIEITGVRIERGQHALNGGLDQLLVGHLLDVFGPHALEHVAEQLELPERVR